MSLQLKNFRIEALHGAWTIDVPIQDNRIVLVGENGTGKSTIANLIYFFLARQWNRMLKYEFNSITAVIDSNSITLTRDELEKTYGAESVSGKYPTLYARRLESLLRGMPLNMPLEETDLREIAKLAGLPMSFVVEFFSRRHPDDIQSEQLRDKYKLLEDSISEQILYLPTYRRIEQDLRSIFPGIDDEIRSFRDHEKRKRRDTSSIELVEFGMEDVDDTIQEKMDQIKEYVRTSLNDLTGTYLRDVIRGTYRNSDLFAKLKAVDKDATDAIFSRIPKVILPDAEQNRLRQIIAKIQRDGKIESDDQVVAHFLTQLIDLYRKQQDNEKEIREFIRVCNGYLSPNKEMVYDDLDFKVFVRQTESRKTPLLFKLLSSGEKQIISLFSHVYLSGNKGYFVIIDEPELSLSVVWQKQFLLDIINTGICVGLIAVTHSPFVYAGTELEKYGRSIDELVEK